VLVQESIRALLKCLLTTHTSVTFVAGKELNLYLSITGMRAKTEDHLSWEWAYLSPVHCFGRWAANPYLSILQGYLFATPGSEMTRWW